MQPLARKVFHKDPVWFAPPILTSEFRNIILGFIRARKLDNKDAPELVARVELVFHQRIKEIPSAMVLDLAFTSGCSAYDGEYVALAQMLRSRLVTNDKFLLRVFPRIAVSIEDFCA
jgi:predicted nucleic acid-binding protein